MSYIVGSGVMVDDGTYIRCPFNSTHRILAQRFPYHFVKCKENYPDVEIAHCPYNAKHCLRKEELADHIAGCPQRSKIGNVVVRTPTSSSAFRPHTAPSMIDKSFANEKVAAVPSVAYNEPLPTCNAEITNQPVVETTTTTAVAAAVVSNYISYTALALEGELLKQSLLDLLSQTEAAT